MKNRKLKVYKGIKELKLEDLGKINVFCGRNNSGKSSILEALSDKNYSFMGVKLTDDAIELLKSRFESINRYSDPHPKTCRDWFAQEIQRLKGRTFFEDDVAEINKYLQSRIIIEGSPLRRYGATIFNFENILKSLFDGDRETGQTILIPPQRRLETVTDVSGLNRGRDSDGAGVLSRLFYLRCQDQHTAEHKTFQTIYEAFYQTTNFYFFICPGADNKIRLMFSNDAKNWITADACGLGLRDVLVILSFVLDSDCNILLIEEPESHIHHDVQRRLLRVLESVPKQIFLTTHSAVFLDPVVVDKVYFCQMDDGGVNATDQTSNALILESLGFLNVDNLTSDLVVLVEGALDIGVYQEIFDKFASLKMFKIKFFPLGGDVMEHVEPSLFAEKNKVVAIIDKDPRSAEARAKFLSFCKKEKIPCFILKKYAIENYYSIAAIRSAFPEREVQLDQISPDRSVKEQLGFSVKRKGKRIVSSMVRDDFKDTDIERIVEEIKTYVARVNPVHVNRTPSGGEG